MWSLCSSTVPADSHTFFYLFLPYPCNEASGAQSGDNVPKVTELVAGLRLTPTLPPPFTFSMQPTHPLPVLLPFSGGAQHGPRSGTAAPKTPFAAAALPPTTHLFWRPGGNGGPEPLWRCCQMNCLRQGPRLQGSFGYPSPRWGFCDCLLGSRASGPQEWHQSHLLTASPLFSFTAKNLSSQPNFLSIYFELALG